MAKHNATFERLGIRRSLAYHPTIGHLYVPGVKARIEREQGAWLIRANEAGFRSNREFAAAKAPGTFRTLLFGDSFTAGGSVNNEHRYSDLLEAMIPGLEVYNFGLPNTGTDQQYLTFREFAPRFEHDLIVIGLQVENIQRLARYRPWALPTETVFYAKPYFTLQPGGCLELHGVPVPREPVPSGSVPPDQWQYLGRTRNLEWARRFVKPLGARGRRLARSLARRLSSNERLSAYNRADDQRWLLMKAILERWTREAAVPVVIFVIPRYQFTEERASAASYQARFAELHDPPRVTVHDPLPALLPYPARERRAFRFSDRDVHPTPEGHRALADSLAPCIRSLMTIRAS